MADGRTERTDTVSPECTEDKKTGQFCPPEGRDKRRWVSPDTQQSGLSFGNQLADVLLRGYLAHGNHKAQKGDGVQDGGCVGDQVCGTMYCDLSTCKEPGKPGYPLCCWPASTHVPTSVLLAPALNIEAISTEMNAVDCSDKLSINYWQEQNHAQDINFIFPAYADAVPKDLKSCPSGCPDRFKPICQNGTCTEPSCEQALQYCNLPTAVGDRARLFCGATCGCGVHSSLQLWTGPRWGCGPICHESTVQQLLTAPCKDVDANSPIFSELEKVLPQLDEVPGFTFHGLAASTPSFVKELKEHGCKALLKEEFRDAAQTFCERTHGQVEQKSGSVFCPQARSLPAHSFASYLYSISS